ncbi:hypothetical protein BURPS406E_G0518 [Burkholderia pseudomallei 406e]|uniref:Uncharacterized protein n=2 Tax=Burkholderia pseudomallei TaxID=28450 RepID=A0A0E1W238_BURPE|nr:hypothetical protein BURPS1106A_A1364 [Burkholderia pseudomallei 1106a]AGZ30862.1 hypothetical protein BBK_6159 [Burkholderia pseudomallei NCTC 13179]EBA49868.1 hypothetical protein BURPS305_5044 [Burkholderia pseudomallei 305]EDO87379.1 hypothetical protein BURPS406E_G0518 [Burkholderia pseudomallei 406e]EEC38507.1 conserved hypothetical protein [Burkholderia pseudomallei 576]EEP49030.1 conserved hypothetical protein [Burkholderia pseudomallei MSHR346]EEP83842.1 conserved hypothetical pro
MQAETSCADFWLCPTFWTPVSAALAEVATINAMSGKYFTLSPSGRDS